MVFDRENLSELLNHNVLNVTFTKMDGTERIMRCTLLSEHVPNAVTANGKVVLSKRMVGDNISVWDMDAKAWRSFKPDRVKSVSILG